MKKNYVSAIYIVLFLLTSCGTFLNQPFETSKARIGENTSSKSVLSGIVPVKEMVVGVYKFRDQTGQYKLVENGSTFSTAVTQGGTSILLKSLEESKWFTPIERENIGNLLNERQIIRSTRQEYAKNSNESQVTSLPPLLFAGIILEGGVISYDSNIITGGSGARYFGVGGASEYREDRITVYLRAVSTSSGQILKNVYVSKTILSQGISANLFRYVNIKRLLEVETGVTKNEPAQLAVKEAIDKAVENLIIEGIIDGLWIPEGGDSVVNLVKEKYLQEKEEAESTVLLDRKLEDRRGKAAINLDGAMVIPNNDYGDAIEKLGVNASLKLYFKKPGFNLNLGASYFELENKNSFKDQFLSIDINVGYDILPYDNISPFVYAGFGAVSNNKVINYFDSLKFQFGGGIEYLPKNNLGIKIFAEQNILFTDDMDRLVQGKWNDAYYKIGLGLNFYFGEPYKNVKSVIFE